MENFLGTKVKSKAFGFGNVTDQQGSRITVEFDQAGLSRDYTAPGCFHRYLEISEFSHPAERKERWRDFDSVHSFLSYYKTLLDSEIEESLTNSTNRVELFDGICLGKEGYSTLYCFQAESSAKLPINFPIRVRTDDGSLLNGEVIYSEEKKYHLVLEEYIGEKIDSLEAFTDATFILQKLRDNFELTIPNSFLAEKLILDKKQYLDDSQEIIQGQEKACQNALTQDILFIWGPPGTGKTFTLAEISKQFLSLGKRVLILSNNNIAVDQALLKIGSVNKIDGKILRFGYPADEKIRSTELSSFNYALFQNKEINEQREALLNKLNDEDLTQEYVLQIRAQLKEIREFIKAEEEKLVGEAHLVGTTLAKAILKPELFLGKFDVVLLDEAGTSIIPAAVYASSLAKEKFIGLGDFRQLGPIVLSENSKDLRHDLFDFAYITQAVNKGQSHKWLVMLNKQYRMNPEIAELVSGPVYRGLLQSDKSTLNKTTKITADCPFPNEPIIRIDISELGHRNLKVRKYGRSSCLCFESAVISVLLALQHHGSTAIVTPFREQAKLIRAILNNITEDSHAQNIKCATIHSFQGSEKEMVILDLVQDHGGLSSIFLQDEDDSCERLINVAITRAQGKLIVIGSFSYFERNIQSDSLLKKLIESGKRADFSQLRRIINTEPDNSVNLHIYSRKEAKDLLLQDLESVQESVYFGYPEKYYCPEKYQNRINELKGSNTRLPKGEMDDQNGFSEFISAKIETGAKVPAVVIDKNISWINFPFYIPHIKNDAAFDFCIRVANDKVAKMIRRL